MAGGPGSGQGAAAPALRRRLGLGLLTLYGMGVMVGAGIYVLVGVVAGQAGPWAPVSFLVAGLIALPTALSYAELSGRVPQAAGEAAYVREATGLVAAAAVAGLALETVGVVSAAAVLSGGVGYLQALVPLPAPVLVVAVGLALGAAAAVGVLESMRLAAALTLIEIGGLLLIVGAGALAEPAVQPAATGPAVPAWGIMAGAVLAFFAFLGFEDIVNMVEETRAPARTVPRAIFLALALTSLLYVAVAWAAVRTVEADRLAESRQPLALVFETATGGGAGVLSLIAVAAALNGVLAQVVMSARVLFGLGRFWRPLRVFHAAHPRFGTPLLATGVCTAATVALALSAPVELLAEWSAVILLGVFVAVNGALIALRRRGPAPPGVFAAPPWGPWLGLALAAGAGTWGLLT